jgi:AcrR family transcriptional regulator
MAKKTEQPYNKKHIQIVETSKDLFFKHGIRRITIEEICRKAGVSKMTFYKHFRNKSQLVKMILDIIVEENFAKYRSVMNRTDITFEEKVRLMIQMKMEGISNFGDEFYDDYMVKNNPDLAAYIQENSGKVLREVLNDFKNARQMGYIRKDIKPEFIMFFMTHIFDLAKDTRLLMLYEHPQEVIMELTNFLFYGILNRK